MRLDDVPMPLLRPDWVLIKVKVVQPSVTEVVAFEGSGGGGATSTFFKGGVLPLQLFGHEFSGEVVDVGEGVTSLQMGSRVAVWNARLACGACPACRSGEEDRCQNVRTIGDETLPGCFAEYAAIPASCLVEIPDTISYGEGACIQALTACLKTVALAEIALGDTVVVQGQGAMGLGIMQIARLAG
ncbi:MAG: alcohol dehydrogenase catalytic domain-containing protein, partial [Dehalococcoidia bacterium]|nr:alcohol dehydrogenase catalytic domain-containing protein [Dehalococcoidia bacterium]